MANHTTLHINCQAKDKAAWMLSARINGTTFDSWIVQQLNAAIKDTNPPWAKGLSERARICLLCAGFDSRESVKNSYTQGFDFASIPNAGNQIKNEIDIWIK